MKELNDELDKCSKNKYAGRGYPEPMIEFDVSEEDETRLLIWGVAGNTLNVHNKLNLSIDDGGEEEDFLEGSCFKKQNISESSLLVYSKEGRKFEDFIGSCIDCADTLAQEIKNNPGVEGTIRALQKLSMDSLYSEIEEYIEKLKVETDIDELEDLEKSLLAKVKKFISGDLEKGHDGLIAHYMALLNKMKGKGEDDEGYKVMQSEKEHIEKFLKFLAENFIPTGAVVQHLKKHHAYEAAKKVGWIGIATGVAIDPKNKKASIKGMFVGINEKHRNWAAKSLEPHKKQWKINKRLQYARKHPEAGTSDIYINRYSEKKSEYLDVSRKNAKWQKKAMQQIHESCFNTKHFGPFRMQFGPFLESGRKRMYHNCRLSQRHLEKGLRNRRYEQQRLLQQAQAFGNQAQLFRNAEMQGIREAREQGKFFYEGFGHSNDLYSPWLNNHEFYRQYGPQNVPMPPPSFLGNAGNFGLDPRLNLMGNNFSVYPQHPNLGPSIFNNGPPPYAMPPNFNNPHLGGFPSRGNGGGVWRGPTGRHDPYY